MSEYIFQIEGRNREERPKAKDIKTMMISVVEAEKPAFRNLW